MKHLALPLLVILFSWQWPTPGLGQQKKIQPVAIIATTEAFRTTDGIHYFEARTKQPMHGTFDLYEVEIITFRRDSTYINDTVEPPLKSFTNCRSRGTFTRGLKTGTWMYYQDKRKIKEETFRNGRCVSSRNCPCPK